jgi:hypothetical protein
MPAESFPELSLSCHNQQEEDLELPSIPERLKAKSCLMTVLLAYYFHIKIFLLPEMLPIPLNT